MEHTAHLWLFFVLVFGIVALPGLDMAFVLASALGGGRKAGLAAVAGIVAGGVCHVAVAGTGAAMLLKVVPAAFNTLLWLGALYVAWIGFSLFRGGAAFTATPAGAKQAASATFRQGLMTNLLNPKAYLFMLAVFPQFLRPEYGPGWLQTLVLGTIIALTQVAVYGTIALVGDQARGWLESNPRASVAVGRTLGALMLLVAVLTALQEWRSA